MSSKGNDFRRRLFVVANPAAGGEEPVLSTLDRVFGDCALSWEIAVTHGPGDARRLAREAAAAEFDLVAAYGGDGTVMEVANGLYGSDVPMGILPGGTGNGVARELNIPSPLDRAAALLCRPPAVRRLDMGRIGERFFLLHAYTGVAKETRADRDSKDSLGRLAYLQQVFQVLTHAEAHRFALTIDGEAHEEEGTLCLIVNALGLDINLPLERPIDPQDGLLDVLLLKNAPAAAVGGLLGLELSQEVFRHWRCRKVTIRPATPLDYMVDGEEAGQTPLTAEVYHQALPVVAP